MSGSLPGGRPECCRDLRLEVESPWVVVRASTTKNHRAAAIPLRPDVVNSLREIVKPDCGPLHRPFKGLPRMPRFKKDLAAAGIPHLNEAGEVVDFHSLRHTFGTYLVLTGSPQRLAQELMRHSDPHLTSGVYQHIGAQQMSAAVLKLPSLFSGGTAKGTHELVPECPKLSEGADEEKKLPVLQTPGSEVISPGLSGGVQPCQSDKMVRAAGFESENQASKIKVSGARDTVKGTQASQISLQCVEAAGEWHEQVAAQVAQHMSELQEVAAAWLRLPAPLRVAVLAMIRSQNTTQTATRGNS